MVISLASLQNLFLKRSILYLSNVKMCSSISITPSIEKLRTNARKIFEEGVQSVQPNNLILNAINVEDDSTFTVNNERFKISQHVYVVGFGKAVAGMARSVEDLFGERIKKAIISIPLGTTKTMTSCSALHLLPKENSKIQVYEGAENNLPDEDSFFATQQMLSLVSELKPEDLLFVLISGGGSALLSYPKPPVTLQEKSNFIKALSSKGASIQELNCIRKRLSVVKGGGLARAAFPSQVISLILSDVIGDPLDLIASSPTVVNQDSTEKVLNILKKYLPFDSVPKSILDCLTDENPTDQNPQMSFSHVHNYLIGTNVKTLKESKTYAESLGYSVFILSSTLCGEASKVGKCFATLAKAILDSSQNKDVTSAVPNISLQFEISSEIIAALVKAVAEELTMEKPCCVLSGGETTVTIKGSGTGGRNQEMSLSFGIESANIFDSENNNILFLNAGTDGIDGPTDAAGAMAHLKTVSEARKFNLDPELFLSNNDSYSFFKSFKSGRDHIVIGHTGTNVMDLQVLLLHPEL